MNLGTVSKRDKLQPRRNPYFHKLGAGEFLGFRKLSHDAVGTWIARVYDAGQRKQRFQALGTFDHLQPSERYGAASKAARDWLKHLNAGGRHEVITVREVCERYVDRLQREKGETQAKEAQARFARYVDNDLIASVPLPKLKRSHVVDWRVRLQDLPAVITRKGKGQGRGRGRPMTRPRSLATINRDMVAFRAALNLALADDYAVSDKPWREALKPIKHTNGRRQLYLDREQRRLLLERLDSDIAVFVRALCVLPLRPGAAAALCVRDFDARQKTLFIPMDKQGGARTIPLPDATLKLLKATARGKLPAAPLFARWDGKRWDKEMWKKPIKEAARVAGLPSETCAYTLRHSTITDLVTDGLDLLTVAQVSGTSVSMIEKHYGKLRGEIARAALSGLVL